jgi:hypothetical protein
MNAPVQTFSPDRRWTIPHSETFTEDGVEYPALDVRQPRIRDLLAAWLDLPDGDHRTPYELIGFPHQPE